MVKVDISVLIVVHFEPLDTIEKNMLNCRFKNLEYVIVDNSVDDTYFSNLKKWRNKLPLEIREKTKLIQAKTNGGFTRGNNIGFKHSNGKYLVILNPDVMIPSDFIEKAYKILIKHNWDILSGKILYNFEEKIVAKGRTVMTMFSPFSLVRLPYANKPDSKNDNHYYEQFYAHGGCCVIRRSIYKELRGFDENFFMYSEESDFCIRAKKRGYKVVYCPELIASHQNEGYPSLFTQSLIYKNQISLIAKNYSCSDFFIQSLFTFSRFFVNLIDKNKHYMLHYDRIRPVIKAILDGVVKGLQYIIHNKSF